MIILNRETITLGFFSAFSVALLTARVLHTDQITYLFLVWNLFLAAIPYVLAQLISFNGSGRLQLLFNLLMVMVWLVFFPNAPYIFTDLFHLRYTSSPIIWYDTTLILSFAWTGMLFGFLSLQSIEDGLARRVGEFRSRLITYVMLFTAAFGVYIGRYLRFNSWDVLSDPFVLGYEIAHRFVSPFSHPRTWGMTFVFGVFLSLAYTSMRLVREVKPMPET